MMVMLPVLVVPFLTMLFIVLGGGRASGTATEVAIDKGLNTALPSAVEKGAPATDKMALYDMADRDSLNLRERLEADPYFRQQYPQSTGAFGTSVPGGQLSTATYGYPGYGNNSGAEARVYERLNELNSSLNQPTPSGTISMNAVGTAPGGLPSKEMEKLESMMQQMQRPAEEDLESKQLNGMLERILDIQHPERVKERLREESRTNRGRVFSVSGMPPASSESMLDSQSSTVSGKAEGFFGREPDRAIEGANSVEAVVSHTQTVTTGTVVGLRLKTDIYVNGHFVPRGHKVWGKVALAGDRLTMEIEHIRSGANLLPVKLVVYDVDGIQGINIPGAIGREVAKESGDRGIQQLGMATLDPSLGAQAMSVGIEAGKNLLSRKVKLVKVRIKAGYRLLLKDENNREY